MGSVGSRLSALLSSKEGVVQQRGRSRKGVAQLLGDDRPTCALRSSGESWIFLVTPRRTRRRGWFAVFFSTIRAPEITTMQVDEQDAMHGVH